MPGFFDDGDVDELNPLPSLGDEVEFVGFLRDTPSLPPVEDTSVHLPASAVLGFSRSFRGNEGSSQIEGGLSISVPLQPTYQLRVPRSSVLSLQNAAMLDSIQPPPPEDAGKSSSEEDRFIGADVFAYCEAYFESNRIVFQQIHDSLEQNDEGRWHRAIAQFRKNCLSIITLSASVDPIFIFPHAILIPNPATIPHSLTSSSSSSSSSSLSSSSSSSSSSPPPLLLLDFSSLPHEFHSLD